MLRLNLAEAALVLIDVQQVFDDPAWGPRSTPAFETRLATLLAAWRQAGGTVAHVRHRSAKPTGRFQPGTPGFAFKPEAEPLLSESVFEKTVNSAFIGTPLEAWLHKSGIKHLVLVGITTDHCVSTTTRMGANLGFTVWVASDATATFDRTGPDGVHHTAETMHQIALASLHYEFATVLPVKDIVAALRP
jgi:nicotinamidase-related amidase